MVFQVVAGANEKDDAQNMVLRLARFYSFDDHRITNTVTRKANLEDSDDQIQRVVSVTTTN
jgi:hypothetical protein